jgi:hypothetical protein
MNLSKHSRPSGLRASRWAASFLSGVSMRYRLLRNKLLLGLFLISILISGCDPKNSTLSTLRSELNIDVYPLENAPSIEPLTIEPINGTQAEIFAKHQREREDIYPDNCPFYTNNPGTPIKYGNSQLIAVNVYSDPIPGQGALEPVSVQVARDGEVIYSIPAGVGSPINTIWGLWTYSNHWVLEIAYVNERITENNEITMEINGQIIQDGILINEQYGYEEAFGFQLLNGKPFYFYKRNVRIGIYYNNQEIQLGYTHVPHYGCCSSWELNPRIAKNMVSFISQREDEWFYVEIGIYN